MVNGQVKRCCTITTCSIHRNVGWSIGRGDVSIAIPYKTVASRGNSVTCGGMPHSQMQRRGAVAAGGVRQGMRGRAIGFGIGVPVNPHVTVADGLYINASAVVWYSNLDGIVHSVALGLLVTMLGNACPHVVDSDDKAVGCGECADGAAGKRDCEGVGT